MDRVSDIDGFDVKLHTYFYLKLRVAQGQGGSNCNVYIMKSYRIQVTAHLKNECCQKRLRSRNTGPNLSLLYEFHNSGINEQIVRHDIILTVLLNNQFSKANSNPNIKTNKFIQTMQSIKSMSCF